MKKDEKQQKTMKNGSNHRQSIRKIVAYYWNSIKTHKKELYLTIKEGTQKERERER